MTISYLGNAMWKGLFADTKPTTAPAGAMFVETDTDRVARYNGSAWVFPEFVQNAGASTYTIYLTGSTPSVKARNNRTGLVDIAVGDNTVNAAATIQSAINNIQNIQNIDAYHGASVSILAGRYKCTTEILLHQLTGAGNAGRSGINLVGEGTGTVLSFEPPASLPNGIRMRGNFNRLAHMLILANSNVVNLVKGEGPAPSAQYNWSVLEHVTCVGPNSNIQLGSANTVLVAGVIPGQVGLYLQGDGGATSFFTANWKVTNCEFFGLDIGIKLIGQHMDMSNWDNIHMGGCETGMIIEGVQHNLSNVRIEGGGGTVTEGVAPAQGAATVGSKGIWIRAPADYPTHQGGNITFLSNINIELHKLDSQGIIIEKECGTTRMSNIYNSSSDGLSKHTYWDNRTVPGVNAVDATEFSNNLVSQSKKRYGSINFGANRIGKENDILNGNVAYKSTNTTPTIVDLADLTTTPFTNGPFATLQTAATTGSGAAIFFNNTGGNRYNKDAYPFVYCRFLPNSITDCKIFIGLWTTLNSGLSQFVAPTGGSDFIGSGSKAGIGLYLDTSLGTNPTHWRIKHNDESGGSTNATFPTHTYGNETYQSNAISTGFVNAVKVSYVPSNTSNPDVLNGPTAAVLHYGKGYDCKTSEVPTSGIFGFLVYIETLANAAKTLRLFDIEFGVTML